MKRVLLVLAVLIVLAGAAFALWKARQEGETGPATTDLPPASNGQPAPSETTFAPGAFDLTPETDGLSKAVATLTMENGIAIKIRFFTSDAPNTVKRITQLISEGFYNGVVVHRVVPGFVVQAGDPTGTGAGGSGVKLKAEFNSHKHEPGIVSMARTSDPNSADSQFFIMLGAAPSLDGQYTVFGKVVAGYEQVAKIQRGDKIKGFTIQ